MEATRVSAVPTELRAAPPRRLRREVNVACDPWGGVEIIGPCASLASLIASIGWVLRRFAPPWPAVGDPLFAFGAFFLGLLALFAIPSLIRCAYEEARQRRLVGEGWAVMGIVTKKECPQTGDHGCVPQVEYTFLTDEGVPLTGSSNRFAGHYDEVEEGGPILILYLPERPEENMPYLVAAYRARLEPS